MKSIKKFTNHKIEMNNIRGGDYWGKSNNTNGTAPDAVLRTGADSAAGDGHLFQ